jgi:hypothetical protein
LSSGLSTSSSFSKYEELSRHCIKVGRNGRDELIIRRFHAANIASKGLVNARVSSDLRSRVEVEVAEMLRARSTKLFEGGRRRLRRRRREGRPQSNGYADSIFFVCRLVILRGLQKSEKSANH